MHIICFNEICTNFLVFLYSRCKYVCAFPALLKAFPCKHYCCAFPAVVAIRNERSQVVPTRACSRCKSYWTPNLIWKDFLINLWALSVSMFVLLHFIPGKTGKMQCAHPLDGTVKLQAQKISLIGPLLEISKQLNRKVRSQTNSTYWIH